MHWNTKCFRKLYFLTSGMRRASFTCLFFFIVLSSSAQYSGMAWGFVGTSTSPTGMALGFVTNDLYVTTYIRLSPMGMAKLMGIDSKKEYYVEDGVFYNEDEDTQDRYYEPTGRVFTRRYSQGVQIGYDLKKNLRWYFGTGFGMKKQTLEYNQYLGGALTDTYLVRNKNKSTLGVEAELGFMLTLRESVIINVGVATVNFSLNRAGIEPAFGLMFINHNENMRVRKLRKFKIK